MGRQRFFFNLGVLGAAVLSIVASVAFGPGGVKGVGLGIGIACVLFCAWFASSLAHQRRHEGYLEFHAFGRSLGVWSVLGGAMASVATWEIIQAAVFDADVAKWLTLANGIVIGARASAGLVAHEVCTERVVHVIEVVERPRPERL
jgi:hypothetical protein